MKKIGVIAFLLVAVAVIFLFFTVTKREELPSQLPSSPKTAPAIDETAAQDTTQETDEEPSTIVVREKESNEIFVEIKDAKFVPEEIEIALGTMVTWSNNDQRPHLIAAYDRTFYSPRLQPGDIFSFTFDKAGTYRYFDAIYPKILNKGRIVVAEGYTSITGRFISLDSIKEAHMPDFLFVLLAGFFMWFLLGIFSN